MLAWRCLLLVSGTVVSDFILEHLCSSLRACSLKYAGRSLLVFASSSKWDFFLKQLFQVTSFVYYFLLLWSWCAYPSFTLELCIMSPQVYSIFVYFQLWLVVVFFRPSLVVWIVHSNLHLLIVENKLEGVEVS